jgi:hypothetical protein
MAAENALLLGVERTHWRRKTPRIPAELAQKGRKIDEKRSKKRPFRTLFEP